MKRKQKRKHQHRHQHKRSSTFRPVGRMIEIEKVPSEEVAKSERVIGFLQWINQEDVAVFTEEGTLIFASERLASTLIAEMGWEDRLSVKLITCAMVYSGFGEGKSYLLIPDPEQKKIGTMSMPEVIGCFGDRMASSKSCPAGILLSSTPRPVGEPAAWLSSTSRI